MKTTKSILLLLSVFCFFLFTAVQCTPTLKPVSASGVSKAEVKVQTDLNGNTVEQRKIQERLRRDNLPGSIKHLYVISSYSGQVLIYSTVDGKVTSSSKRLTPNTVATSYTGGIPITINERTYFTSEMLGDDGTYGSSDPYVYWFDAKGVYHQHYITGGQIIHISDQPLVIKSVIINMELTTNEKE